MLQVSLAPVVEVHDRIIVHTGDIITGGVITGGVITGGGRAYRFYSTNRARRVRDLDRELLRAQESREPPPHLAVAADDQYAPARTMAARRDPIALLHGQ